MPLTAPIDQTVLTERINTWVATLNERKSEHADTFDAERLTKYVRVFTADGNGKARSVHAFVSIATGDVFKPANWRTPAKHVRFNLMDDVSFAAILNRCDPFGSYLYLR